MSAAADGWAIKDRAGDLLVRTVSPTRQAAQVNWLWTYARQFVSDSQTASQIEASWVKLSAGFGATLVRVRIEEVPGP